MNPQTQKAINNLVIDHPFYGSLLLKKLEILEDDTIPTACVNGKEMRINPKYIETLNIPETTGLIAHEVLHCALQHMYRRGNRHNGTWNEATDNAINWLLIDEGFTLPEGALLDPQFKNMNAEDIYNRIPTKKDSEEPGKGEGSTGKFEDPKKEDSKGTEENKDIEGKQGKGGSQAEWQKEQDEWAIAVQQANNQSKAMGKGSPIAEEIIKELFQPKVDWKDELEAFFDSLTKEDFTWRKPNKRHFPLILPSMESEGDLKKVLIGIDSSASVSMNEIKSFFAELDYILETFSAEVTVLVCDTKIRSIQKYQAGETVERTVKGRGGTNFDPCFKWAERTEFEPSCMIYLTDMECTPPLTDNFIDYPVVWASTQNFRTRTGLPEGWEQMPENEVWQKYRDCRDDLVVLVETD